MFRLSRAILATSVVVSALFVSSVASASTASWQEVEVTAHLEQAEAVVIVSGQLPEAAKLPAKAQLSVPAGSKIQWVGEILGGPAENDPDLAYTTAKVGASDVFSFELARSRTAQIEYLRSDSLTFDGKTYQARLVWTATQAVPRVRMSVFVPLGAQIVRNDAGATLQPGASDGSYYTKTVENVKPGDKVELAFSFLPPAAAEAPATAGSGADATQVVLVLLAIVAGGAAAFALGRRAARRTAAPEDDEDDASDASDEEPAAVEKESAPADAEDETPAAPAPRGGTMMRRNLLVAGVVAPVVLVVVALMLNSGRPVSEGGRITKTFSSQGEACTSASIALTVPEGSDPAATAETLFAALGPVPSMKDATYDVAGSRLEVGFCESSTSEQAIRQALAPTGLVAQASDGASSTP